MQILNWVLVVLAAPFLRHVGLALSNRAKWRRLHVRMAANEVRLSQISSRLPTSQNNYFFKTWWGFCDTSQATIRLADVPPCPKVHKRMQSGGSFFWT